jgi:dTDP-4-amino-4,6-dideoxygalactose transaminase
MAPMKNIPYGHQSVNLSDVFAVARGVRSEWMTMGPAVEKFERDISKVAGSTYAIAVSSGSAALHCAYATIGLEPGDEVITTPLTFAATATTAMNLGGVILFADIHPDTGNIDPKSVEALISPRTKAIVAVDYAGHPADMDELMALGKKHGILVIEDAAHSLGSLYKGRPVGSLADITALSFFPTKNITTGEGGAVVTNNADFARKARLFRSHGIVRDKEFLHNTSEGPWHQEVQSLGLNYRMPDLLARLGSSQLHRLPIFHKKRKQVFLGYKENLSHVPNVTLPVHRPESDPMWHLYPLRVDPRIRRAVFEDLRAAGIGVQVNYIPVNSHPYFRELGFTPDSTPHARDYYAGEISLPMFADLSPRSVKVISKKVADLCRSKK